MTKDVLFLAILTKPHPVFCLEGCFRVHSCVSMSCHYKRSWACCLVMAHKAIRVIIVAGILVLFEVHIIRSYFGIIWACPDLATRITEDTFCNFFAASILKRDTSLMHV